MILWEVNFNYRPIFWIHSLVHFVAWFTIYVGNICTDITELLGIKQVILPLLYRKQHCYCHCFTDLLQYYEFTWSKFEKITTITKINWSYEASKFYSICINILDVPCYEVKLFIVIYFEVCNFLFSVWIDSSWLLFLLHICTWLGILMKETIIITNISMRGSILNWKTLRGIATN